MLMFQVFSHYSKCCMVRVGNCMVIGGGGALCCGLLHRWKQRKARSVCVCVCRCVPFDRKWTFAISNSKGTNMFSSKGTANGIGNKGTSIHHLYRKSVKSTSTDIPCSGSREQWTLHRDPVEWNAPCVLLATEMSPKRPSRSSCFLEVPEVPSFSLVSTIQR